MAPSTRTLTRAAAVAGVAALALAGCTGGGNDDPTTEPATSTETTAAPTTPAGTPTDGPTAGPTPGPTAGTDEPTGGSDLPPMSADEQSSPGWPGSGGDLLPTAVRTGAHDGFDRVVIDLDGSDEPGWSARYVDEAIQDGSGNVVDVDGDAILEVVFSGGRYPEEDEDYPAGSTDVDDYEALEEVRLDGVFEGLTQVFIGVDSAEPFRVFTLTDPVRLVIDIAHPTD